MPNENLGIRLYARQFLWKKYGISFKADNLYLKKSGLSFVSSVLFVYFPKLHCLVATKSVLFNSMIYIMNGSLVKHLYKKPEACGSSPSIVKLTQ